MNESESYRGFNLWEVFSSVVELIPEGDCLVWRDRRLSFADVRERAQQVSWVLRQEGRGLRANRDRSKGHESGQFRPVLRRPLAAQRTVREMEALREYSLRARMLGYDGKWALTPDQVVVLNDMFSPSQGQFDHAFELLEAYRQATVKDRKGAVMFGDEMIDEASRKMAIMFVDHGLRAGLTSSTEKNV